jgi:hypothetical protein
MGGKSTFMRQVALIVLLAISVWPPLTLWLPHLIMGR